jgi:hypothetical protein
MLTTRASRASSRREFARDALALALASGAFLRGIRTSSADDGNGAPLSPLERETLARGALVMRRYTREGGSTRYIGGVAYLIVRQDTERIAELVDKLSLWPKLLPLVKRVTLRGEALDRGEERERLVEFEHIPLSIQYSLLIRNAGPNLKFWLDRSRSHDVVVDMWGSMSASAVASSRDSNAKGTLLRFGAYVGVNEGPVERAVEGRVQRAMLNIPIRIKQQLDTQ